MNNLVSLYNELVSDDQKLSPIEELYPHLDFVQAINSFLRESGGDPEKVLFAYVHGSYCRQERSKYSDIDLIVYTEDFRGDYIFNYQGHMLNLNFKPISMINEIVSGSNILWNLGVHKNMQIVYDKKNYAEYFRKFLKQTFKELKASPSMFINSFATEIRRIVEYRRKLVSFINTHDIAHDPIDQYTYLDLLNKYIFNFFSVLGFFEDIYFPSEKNFYRFIHSSLYPNAQSQLKILINNLEDKSQLIKEIDNIYSYFVEKFRAYITESVTIHEAN